MSEIMKARIAEETYIVDIDCDTSETFNKTEVPHPLSLYRTHKIPKSLCRTQQ